MSAACASGRRAAFRSRATRWSTARRRGTKGKRKRRSFERTRVRPPARAVLLLLLVLGAAALLPAPSRGQPAPAPAPVVPTLRILGFSPQRAPWNELVCRQAAAPRGRRPAVAEGGAAH